MRDDELPLLDLALEKGAINQKQADMLRTELEMFPGQKVGMLLVRKGFITPDVLVKLREAATAAAAPPVEEEKLFIEAPARPAPAPPPSAAQLPAHLAARLVTGPPGSMPPRPAAPPPAASPSFLAAALDAVAGNPVTVPPAPAAAPPPPPPRPAPTAASSTQIEAMTLDDLLKAGRDLDASDLHISVGRPPFVRRHGLIHYMQAAPLTPERAQKLIFSRLNNPQDEELRREQQLDFALEIPGQGRYRCNAYHQQYGWEGSFRIVPSRIPTLAEIGLPPAVQKLTEYHNGMIVVTGPAGSGKTTTVAAMIDHVNAHRTDHIITVEDPIEFIIPAKKCQVTQRQAGLHTKSFGAALRAALREDPDIIMVGEMRDIETISIAASAAETGHLVFGTLHTNTATRTVSRIVDSYPPEQREQICTMVSKSMRGVLAQQLIPRKDGKGRALALEILIFTAGVSAQVMEGKTHQLPSLMQTGKKIGMRLMDDALMDLFTQGLITGREAYLRADNKPPFEPIKDR